MQERPENKAYLRRSDFASRAVTKTLQNALSTEFQALGVVRIKVRLNERVELGKMKHKLVLDLPITKKLNEILSEGEQRAIAIGSFLAELRLSGHGGGIVFDDPVSSLDHLRRKDVARRLVEEAKQRQVIILTHDTVFLGELVDEIEQQGVEYLIQHLEWMEEHPGQVNEGLPWEHQGYKERLDRLEKEQKKLEKSWPAYPNAEERDTMRQQYDRLRATMERVIEDVVLAGVVERYGDRVIVGKLVNVLGFTEADCRELHRIYKACCDVVGAHDPPSAKNAPVPSAVQLGEDIESLKGVIEAIRARRKGRAATSA